MDAKIDAAQTAKRLFQQVQAGHEVATLNGQNAAEATAKSVPEVPIVAHRQLVEIRDEFFNGGQIADQQRDRASRLDEHLTQRERIAPRAFVISDIARNLHRLVGISL